MKPQGGATCPTVRRRSREEWRCAGLLAGSIEHFDPPGQHARVRVNDRVHVGPYWGASGGEKAGTDRKRWEAKPLVREHFGSLTPGTGSASIGLENR